jgi:hypothetical protein
MVFEGLELLNRPEEDKASQTNNEYKDKEEKFQ